MFKTKIGFATLVFLLPTSFFLNSCTKNTESNISIDAELNKPKAQLVSSKDPKIPLYAVDIKICKDENYIIATGYDYDEEQGKFSPAPCYENSLPIWGSPDTDIVPESFNPDIYFYRTSVVSNLMTTDSYEIIFPSYGCYSDFKVPQKTENYYLTPLPPVNINKKLTNSEKLVKISRSMANIRRLVDRDEVQDFLLQYHVLKKYPYTECDLIDSSKLPFN